MTDKVHENVRGRITDSPRRREGRGEMENECRSGKRERAIRYNVSLPPCNRSMQQSNRLMICYVQRHGRKMT